MLGSIFGRETLVHSKRIYNVGDSSKSSNHPFLSLKPRKYSKTAPHHSKHNSGPLLRSTILSISETSSQHTKVLTLTRPESLKYLPGQAIDVFVPSSPTDFHPEKATFSIISAPHTLNDATLEIAVKSTSYYPIQWLLNKARIGDSLYLGSNPIGQMFKPVVQAPVAPLLMIGAGIGITPILSIVQFLSMATNTHLMQRKVQIIHQTKNSNEFLLWHRLVAFSKQHPNVELSYFASDDPVLPLLGNEHPELSLLTKPGEISTKHLAKLGLTHSHHVLLCGPTGFVRTVKHVLFSEFGIPAAQIHVDPPIMP